MFEEGAHGGVRNRSSGGEISHGRKGQSEGLPINSQITAPQVRMIGPDGANLGIVARNDALAAAHAAGLDLVQMNDQDVPVVRVMDYGKHKYEQQKKAREVARAARHSGETHQVKLRPMIEEHDYRTKLGLMRKFLERGDRVKVTVMFRGRLVTHPDLGKRLLERVRADVADVATMTEPGPVQGRDMTVMLAPVKPSHGDAH